MNGPVLRTYAVVNKQAPPLYYTDSPPDFITIIDTLNALGSMRARYSENELRDENGENNETSDFGGNNNNGGSVHNNNRLFSIISSSPSFSTSNNHSHQCLICRSDSTNEVTVCPGCHYSFHYTCLDREATTHDWFICPDCNITTFIRSENSGVIALDQLVIDSLLRYPSGANTASIRERQFSEQQQSQHQNQNQNQRQSEQDQNQDSEASGGNNVLHRSIGSPWMRPSSNSSSDSTSQGRIYNNWQMRNSLEVHTRPGSNTSIINSRRLSDYDDDEYENSRGSARDDLDEENFQMYAGQNPFHYRDLEYDNNYDDDEEEEEEEGNVYITTSHHTGSLTTPTLRLTSPFIPPRTYSRSPPLQDHNGYSTNRILNHRSRRVVQPQLPEEEVLSWRLFEQARAANQMEEEQQQRSSDEHENLVSSISNDSSVTANTSEDRGARIIPTVTTTTDAGTATSTNISSSIGGSSSSSSINMNNIDSDGNRYDNNNDSENANSSEILTGSNTRGNENDRNTNNSGLDSLPVLISTGDEQRPRLRRTHEEFTRDHGDGENQENQKERPARAKTTVGNMDPVSERSCDSVSAGSSSTDIHTRAPKKLKLPGRRQHHFRQQMMPSLSSSPSALSRVSSGENLRSEEKLPEHEHRSENGHGNESKSDQRNRAEGESENGGSSTSGSCEMTQMQRLLNSIRRSQQPTFTSCSVGLSSSVSMTNLCSVTPASPQTITTTANSTTSSQRNNDKTSSSSSSSLGGDSHTITNTSFNTRPGSHNVTPNAFRNSLSTPTSRVPSPANCLSTTTSNNKALTFLPSPSSSLSSSPSCMAFPRRISSQQNGDLTITTAAKCGSNTTPNSPTMVVYQPHPQPHQRQYILPSPPQSGRLPPVIPVPLLSPSPANPNFSSLTSLNQNASAGTGVELKTKNHNINLKATSPHNEHSKQNQIKYNTSEDPSSSLCHQFSSKSQGILNNGKYLSGASNTGMEITSSSTYTLASDNKTQNIVTDSFLDNNKSIQDGVDFKRICNNSPGSSSSMDLNKDFTSEGTKSKGTCVSLLNKNSTSAKADNSITNIGNETKPDYTSEHGNQSEHSDKGLRTNNKFQSELKLGTKLSRKPPPPPLSSGDKNRIQEIVRNILRPMYHRKEVSKDEYTEINKRVSRIMYQVVFQEMSVLESGTQESKLPIKQVDTDERENSSGRIKDNEDLNNKKPNDSISTQIKREEEYADEGEEENDDDDDEGDEEEEEEDGYEESGFYDENFGKGNEKKVFKQKNTATPNNNGESGEGSKNKDKVKTCDTDDVNGTSGHEEGKQPLRKLNHSKDPVVTVKYTNKDLERWEKLAMRYVDRERNRQKKRRNDEKKGHELKVSRNKDQDQDEDQGRDRDRDQEQRQTGDPDYVLGQKQGQLQGQMQMQMQTQLILNSSTKSESDCTMNTSKLLAATSNVDNDNNNNNNGTNSTDNNNNNPTKRTASSTAVVTTVV